MEAEKTAQINHFSAMASARRGDCFEAVFATLGSVTAEFV